jgi:outer membrane protein assembly factor BamA
MKAAAAAALLLLAVSARAADGPAAVARISTGTIVVPVETSSQPFIATIIVERANVFDPSVPGENWWPFMVADKIHFITRERVVRDELLFAPGERWDTLKVIQTERNLRASYPFSHAEITPVPRPDGRVDALVRTQDSWTTNPRLGLTTSGGQSSGSVGIEENNVFGYGKSIGYEHDQGHATTGPTHSDSFTYGDPRFLGTRLALSTAFSKTQYGDNESVGVTKPFYALDTPTAETLSWSNSDSIGTELLDATSYSNFTERQRVVNAEYGARLDDDRWFVQRVEGGWYANRQIFGATDQSPATVPGSQPGNLNLSGPTIGYTWLQPLYVKETYINRMDRIEDFNLGNELRARTGYMARDLGSDQDRWIFNASDQQGLGLGEGRFALASAAFSGRVFNNRLENGLATANFNFFWKNYIWTRTRTLVFHVEAAQGHNLDKENQIDLGGSTGLRGYKNDSFIGGRSILANLEDRFFFDGEYFHLVRFGGVVFAESGSVVPEGSGFSPARFRSDVGVGIRAGSSRSTSGNVARLDLAYALNGGPGGSRWVISLTSGQAFNFFNSASQRVATSPGPGL